VGQSPIDRMTAHLADVQPDLGSVTSAQELRAWVEAVIDGVDGTVTRPLPRGGSHTEAGRGASAVDLPASSRSLRCWELMLTEVLERLKARGELSCRADTVTHGAAFAALLYGGVLLGQTSGDRSPLRAALDMAMTQVAGVSLHADGGDSNTAPATPADLDDVGNN
jgi:hypothetical protein